MIDLSPTSFDKLSDQINNDETTAVEYLNMRVQYSDRVTERCDDACRLKLSCAVRNSVYWEGKDCAGLPRIDYRNDPLMSFAERLADPWYLKTSS